MKRDLISIIDGFFSDVDKINSQIDSLCNEIRNAIREILDTWKSLSQEVSNEELIELWEELKMHVSSESAEDPLFWLKGYALIDLGSEGGEANVYFYLKKEDDALYADQEIPGITRLTDNSNEHRIELHGCGLNELLEVIDVIKQSFNDLPDKILQKRAKDSVKRFQSRKRRMML